MDIMKFKYTKIKNVKKMNNYEKSIALLFESQKELGKATVVLGDKENVLLNEAIGLMDKAQRKIVEYCEKKKITYRYDKAIIKIES